MRSEMHLPTDHLTRWPQRPSEEAAPRPLYEPPSVFSYTDQDILDQLGPAQTVLSTGCSSTGMCN